MRVVIGTRGSRLALVQAHWVEAELRRLQFEPEVKIIRTKGDVVKDRFDKMEGKGFFTKEIEDALIEREIDVAVHCLKDLPTAGTPGLALSAIPVREDARDVVISRKPLSQGKFGPVLDGLTVGTSSNRRVAGLQEHAPTAIFSPIRGNVPRRIEKMVQGEVDVVVLAQAGLNRLGLDLSKYQVQTLEPEFLVPAPGQGALALQVRAGQEEILRVLHHEETARCTSAERKILAYLEGGCQLPLGVYVHPWKTGYRMFLYLGDIQKKRAGRRLLLEASSPEDLVEKALSELH